MPSKLYKELNAQINQLEKDFKSREEIDLKDNPIQANPANANNTLLQLDSDNLPDDKEPEEKKFMNEIKELEEALKKKIGR